MNRLVLALLFFVASVFAAKPQQRLSDILPENIDDEKFNVKQWLEEENGRAKLEQFHEAVLRQEVSERDAAVWVAGSASAAHWTSADIPQMVARRLSGDSLEETCLTGEEPRGCGADLAGCTVCPMYARKTCCFDQHPLESKTAGMIQSYYNGDYAEALLQYNNENKVQSCLDELNMLMCAGCSPDAASFVNWPLLAQLFTPTDLFTSGPYLSTYGYVNLCSDFCSRLENTCGKLEAGDGSGEDLQTHWSGKGEGTFCQQISQVGLLTGVYGVLGQGKADEMALVRDRFVANIKDFGFEPACFNAAQGTRTAATAQALFALSAAFVATALAATL